MTLLPWLGGARAQRGRRRHPARLRRVALAVLIASLAVLAPGLLSLNEATPVAVAATSAATAVSTAGAASTPSPLPSGAPATGLESRSAAAQWVSTDGTDLVRERSGSTEAVISDLLPVRAWSATFLDGSDPAHATTDTGQWAATARTSDSAFGVLLVSVTQAGASGVLVQDPELATALDVSSTLEGAEVVLSQDDATWYLVREGTVTALGSAARSVLAGPVEVATYSEVVRERRGDLPVDGASSSAPETDRRLVWATESVVALIALTVLLLTIRHERRVMAPLRQSAATTVTSTSPVLPAACVATSVTGVPSDAARPETGPGD